VGGSRTMPNDWYRPVVYVGLMMVAWLAGAGPVALPGAHATAAHLTDRTPSQGAPPALLHHGNLSTNLTPLSGTQPPGSAVAVGYSVVPEYNVSGGTLSIGIPPILAELPSSTGTLSLYFHALNVSVAGGATATGILGPPARFAQGVVLNGNGSGIVSSQGVAVMSSWSDASHGLQFRWRWVLIGPDGSLTTGPYSVPQTVFPAQTATPYPAPSKTWTVGSPYTFCLSGPIGGRSFTLRLAISQPPATIALPVADVPAGSAAYCWNSTLPQGVSSQPGVLHLWELANVSFLLAAVDIQLVPARTSGSGAASGAWFGSSLPLWLLAAFGVVGVIVVAEVAWLAVRASPSHRRFGPPPGATRAPSTQLPPGTGGAH
jgi:hypothetical protein